MCMGYLCKGDDNKNSVYSLYKWSGWIKGSSNERGGREAEEGLFTELKYVNFVSYKIHIPFPFGMQILL